jgi:hypothetical protein
MCPGTVKVRSEPAETAVAGIGQVKTGSAPADAWLAPKRFLLDVMNNEALELALRIEAAKALLPYFNEPRRP